jgi:hypothetical protein
METLAIIVAGTPLRWCIIGAGLVAAIAQAWLMLVAVRRRARKRRLRAAAESGAWDSVAGARIPRPLPEIVALVALLLIPIATIASITRARGAAPIASWSGRLNSISLGILVEELAAGVGVVAWGLAFAARHQMRGLVHGAAMATGGADGREAEAWAHCPYPETETVLVCAAAIAALVLLPALEGALAYCVRVATKLASHSAAGAAPADVISQMGPVLVGARRALASGISASQVGLALSAVTCIGVLRWRSPARARRRWLGRPERAAPIRLGTPGDLVWAVLACALVAITLALVALAGRAVHFTRQMS